MIRTYAPINNFITAFYDKRIFVDTVPHIPNIPTKLFKEYLNSQKLFYEFAIWQIRKFYPLAHIHVLTNYTKLKDDNNVTHHYFDFNTKNHTIKFKIFSLLKEAAMYIDTDIWLRRRFQLKHLPSENPFNLFSYSYINIDLQKLASQPIPDAFKITNVYNNGLIWIARPSQELTEELTDIHYRYFRKRPNDEWATTLYVLTNNLNMKVINDVNVIRHTIKSPSNEQSIHYQGIENKHNHLFKEIPYFKDLGII